MMEAADVIAIVRCLSAAGVAYWLDGGWGVDALLGAQTRPHEDLDLVAAAEDDARLHAALAPLGYTPYIDERPTRYVLRAPGDRRIDVHPVTFDAEGGGLQAQPEGPPFRYPPEGLAGVGQVAGVLVRCLTPELQLRCHSGYEPDDDDRRDMRLLCARFGLTWSVVSGQWSVVSGQNGRRLRPLTTGYRAVRPPSIISAEPVTKAASSDAK